MTDSSPIATVYTTNFCGYCVRATRLLDKRGIPYREINIAGDHATRAELMSRTKFRTLPQIFIGSTFVGGSDELVALDRKGDLIPLVEAEQA